MKSSWIILAVYLGVHRFGLSSTSSIQSDIPLFVASFSERVTDNNVTNSNGGTSSSSTPLFYGWFFNESTAESISIIGKKYFLSAYDKVPKFQEYINQLLIKNNVTNPLEFYTKPLDPDTGLPDLKYHTTAKYCGRNNSVLLEECNEYLEQVGQYLGRPYKMHLVGLFFTNNTYGIRLKLTGQEQKLFQEDTRANSAQQSESEPNNEIERFAPEHNHQRHFSYEPYYYSNNNNQKDGTKKNSPYYPGINFRPQERNFHPTESRAHITLGCAPGILAVQTGLDLLNIIDLEVSTFSHHEDFSVGGSGIEIPKAVLREIKTETSDMGVYTTTAFVVYPDDQMIADAVFDAYL